MAIGRNYVNFDIFGKVYSNKLNAKLDYYAAYGNFKNPYLVLFINFFQRIFLFIDKNIFKNNNNTNIVDKYIL